MNLGRDWVSTLLVASCIGVAVASSGVAQAADSQSGDLIPVVLRGVAGDGAPSSVTDGSPVVLRGSSARPEPSPGPANACLPGYQYDPPYGCVAPDYGYTFQDYGYGYWPYWGFDGFFPANERHGFRHAFVGGPRHGFAVRSGAPFRNGFGRGSAHTAGLGQR